jgi:hypothetical protein
MKNQSLVNIPFFASITDAVITLWAYSPSTFGMTGFFGLNATNVSASVQMPSKGFILLGFGKHLFGSSFLA